MKQVPCWRSTNIRHHHTNCSQHSDLAPGFVHPWFTLLFTHFPDLQNNNGLLSEVTLKSEIQQEETKVLKPYYSVTK